MRSTMYNNPYMVQLNNVNKQLANLVPQATNYPKPSINIVNQKNKQQPLPEPNIMIMTSYNTNQ
jgi:hypothetical protein